VIAVSVFLGSNLRNICIAIGIIAIPAFARIARASTLAFAQREFVTAARAMGAKNGRIILREILPNVVLPVTAFALIVVAVAIVAEGALAFLGLSVQDPTPSWGSMIDDGRPKLNEGIAHISLIPAGAMFLTVLSFNMLGDRFRAFFDVRESRL
jgi:peptide/nickel transport system permease protein